MCGAVGRSSSTVGIASGVGDISNVDNGVIKASVELRDGRRKGAVILKPHPH